MLHIVVHQTPNVESCTGLTMSDGVCVRQTHMRCNRMRHSRQRQRLISWAQIGSRRTLQHDFVQCRNYVGVLGIGDHIFVLHAPRDGNRLVSVQVPTNIFKDRGRHHTKSFTLSNRRKNGKYFTNSSRATKSEKLDNPVVSL